jgi:hypothetical protein
MEVLCLNCQKQFDAVRKSAKFCTDVCRATYAKKIAKDNGMKPATEIPPPQKSTQEVVNSPSLSEADLRLMELGKRTEALLKAKKAPEEAFFEWADENWGKKPEKIKKEVPTENKEVHTNDGLISVEDYDKLPKSEKMRWAGRIRGVTA